MPADCGGWSSHNSRIGVGDWFSISRDSQSASRAARATRKQQCEEGRGGLSSNTPLKRRNRNPDASRAKSPQAARMSTPERQRQNRVGRDSGGLTEHPEESVTGKSMESAHPCGRWSDGSDGHVTRRGRSSSCHRSSEATPRLHDRSGAPARLPSMGCGYLQKRAHTLNVRSPIRGVLLQFQFTGMNGPQPRFVRKRSRTVMRAETYFGLGWHPG